MCVQLKPKRMKNLLLFFSFHQHKFLRMYKQSHITTHQSMNNANRQHSMKKERKIKSNINKEKPKYFTFHTTQYNQEGMDSFASVFRNTKNNNKNWTAKLRKSCTPAFYYYRIRCELWYHLQIWMEPIIRYKSITTTTTKMRAQNYT